MNSISNPSPLDSRYPTIEALFQAHRDLELTGPEDCMEFLKRDDIEGFILREVAKRVERSRYQRRNLADEVNEKLEEDVILETLKAMRNSEKINRYLARGRFTDDESGQATPTRRACVKYFICLGVRIFKLRLKDHWKQSYRLRKRAIGVDDEAMELRRSELLKYAMRIFANIAGLCEGHLKARMEKNSEHHKPEIEALLDWKFGGFETADKAAECHGANVKKVYAIWENINRVRDGKCPVHTWALKNHPKLKDEINKAFECWYQIKDNYGKDWSSLLPRNPKQQSGSGT